MKIAILGDSHGNFQKLEENLKKIDVDLILQVGDFVGSRFIPKEEEEYKSPSKLIYFVPGNHEVWDNLEPLTPLSKTKVYDVVDNLKFIPLGHSFTFKGIKIVGFGGNYSKKRYVWKRNELQHERRRHYTESDFERALSQESCDILLTHEPASPFPWRGSDAGSPIITSLVARLRPKYHFFGHMHVYREQMIGDCKSYCIPIHEFRIFEV